MPPDEHERSRREHQAHVEVAQGEHVSLGSGGSPVARGPQTPAATRRGSEQHDATPDGHARARARRRAHRRRARGAAHLALGARSSARCEPASARHEARPDQGRLERLVLPGAGQAQGVVVGVEVWHVRRATLQTRRKSPHAHLRRTCRSAPHLLRRLSGVCGSAATLPGLGLRNKFVTCATPVPTRDFARACGGRRRRGEPRQSPARHRPGEPTSSTEIASTSRPPTMSSRK